MKLIVGIKINMENSKELITSSTIIDNEKYVTVRFEEFNVDYDMKGGGTYEERPIMVDNMFPIGYDEIKSEFVNYDVKSDLDRENFLDNLGFDDM